MTELKTRRSRSERRPSKTYLIKELEATSRKTIDSRKIVDLVGEEIVMTISQEDWRGAVIGSSTRCSGARSIVHNVPGCEAAAVGDQFGYMLMTGGRCVRFQHNGVVNTAQDEGRCPIGETLRLQPVRPAQRMGARPAHKRNKPNNPPVPTPLRGTKGKNMVVLTTEKCTDAAPKAEAPAAATAPRTGSGQTGTGPANNAGRSRLDTPAMKKAVAAAPTTGTAPVLAQPKPRTFGLATQMRMTTAKEAFERHNRRQKRAVMARTTHAVH